jgi:SNF2 family DNA or RNA helicase
VSINTYQFKTKPYKHQVQGVKFAFRQWNKGLGAAFLFDPRTGKTKTSIDAIGALHLKHGVRRVLVICPNRVMGVWVQEFHTHSSLHVQCIIWDAKGRRRPLPKLVSPYDLQVVIINFEAFSTPGKRLPSGRRSRKTGRFATRDKINQWVNIDHTPAAAIVDEGHKIKAPSGKSSTAIVSMRDLFDYRLLLTGTPVTKAHRIHDIYMQWQWVNPNRFKRWGPDASSFREHVGVWTERNGFPQWLRAKPRGVEDARRGMHEDGMVVRRADCFDLPERMPDRIIPVKLSARTAKVYNDMAETMIAEIEEGVIAEASIPLVVMLRLQQITGGFVGITPDTDDEVKRRAMAKTHRVGTEKLDVLRELLIEEYLDRFEEEKVIVAGKYKRDLNDITRMVADLGIKQFTIRGGMPRWESDEQVVKFRRQRGMALMLVQPDAASLGIDLSSASHMVWYSLTNSWVNWTQCCDRIALSDQSTSFTYLQVPGSIDTLMYDGLINDTNVARYIMKRPGKLRLKK